MSNYNSYLGNKKCCSTTGPQGPQGPRGFQGPIGPPGLAGTGSGLNSGLTGVDSGLGSMLVINPDTGKVAYNNILEVIDDTNVTISGNLIPSSNYTWDLGSTGLRFKTIYAEHIYAAANTINLGDAKIHSTGDVIMFDNKINIGGVLLSSVINTIDGSKSLVLPNHIKIGEDTNHAILSVTHGKIDLDDVIISNSSPKQSCSK